jgi:hypothetical protein
MHKLVVLAALAVSAPVLAASCVAEVVDAPDDPTVDDLGLRQSGGPTSPVQKWIDTHHGGCAHACTAVLVGGCQLNGETLQDACGNEYESEDVDFLSCGGIDLTCAAVEHAAHGGAAGLQWCWESCGGWLGH